MDMFVAGMARRKQGDARIYERFLGAVVDAGVADFVVPLRLSSVTGARLVYAMQYTVDVIYLDSAHEFGETFVELSMYWETLKPGGVLMGDDYDWASVKHDLDLFVQMKGIGPLQFDSGAWFLAKPA